MLLRRDAYIQGCFYTRVLLHRDAFHKGVLLHTDVDAHTDAFIRRCFYAQLHRCFYTGMLLHKGAFARRHAGASTHRCLYTSMRLHGAFTHMCFYTGSHSTQSTLYTEKLVHKYSYADFFYAPMHLYRGIFETQTIHRYCYKEEFCTDIFTQGCFYTQALLELGRF